MAEAYLGLGSNLGDKRAMLTGALARLDATPGIRVTARSRFYRTPPWGDTNQDWFLNAAAALDTTLSPADLLAACLQVERQLGRVRERKWGPRSIDIDVLAYGQEAVDDPDLVLPHPFVLERAFVLKPLADIAPDLVIGATSVRDALARLDQTGIEPVDP
ncbi:MAG TPA: 2-amino-4-hydroxy-6-hydroxymethyldihydropteridine diphosphokinase [Microvirga sp.]|nr:2-amino-4-hydroxy-6-hydroxymethyldihydropteridine diphosphokinase [Microvirga sp.]